VISSISVYYQFFEVKHELRISVVGVVLHGDSLNVTLLVANYGNQPEHIYEIHTSYGDTPIVGYIYNTNFKSSIFIPGEMKYIKLNCFYVKMAPKEVTHNFPIYLTFYFTNRQGTSLYAKIKIGEFLIEGDHVMFSKYMQKSFDLFDL